MKQKRRILAVILSLVLSVHFVSCGRNTNKTTEDPTEKTTTKIYSEEELKAFLQEIVDERTAHPGDEIHWSRKVMGGGVNTVDHCLDLTIIDCDEATLNDVMEHLEKYPVKTKVVDEYIVTAGSYIIEEHRYKRNSDGTIDEFHYRELEGYENAPEGSRTVGDSKEEYTYRKASKDGK